MYAKARPTAKIRYNDGGSYRWLWTHAPCAWRGNVELQFAMVRMGALRPAGCWTDPAIVAAHVKHIREGRALAPLVVCANGDGGWYLHDGNHRYVAIRALFAGDDDVEVRVAIAVPNGGYRFVYRRFRAYGTYLLEPASPLIDAFGGRTLVLVAHADDETACAGVSAGA